MSLTGTTKFAYYFQFVALLLSDESQIGKLNFYVYIMKLFAVTLLTATAADECEDEGKLTS